MFEKPKSSSRNGMNCQPSPAEFCGVEGCNRHTVVFVKEYNISRCAECFQRDSDFAGESASGAIVDKLNRVTGT